MPLIVNGNHLHEGSKEVFSLLMKNPIKRSLESRDLSKQTIESEGLLYVNQREFGVLSPGDDCLSIIGSEDATTCHIAVLRHTGSGVTALAHCDGCGMKDGMNRMVTKVKVLSKGSPDGRLELFLYGGFSDDRKESEKVSFDLLDIFMKMEDYISLETACITDLNTTQKNNVPFPIIYGIAVNVKTGDIFPATFPNKGPDMDIRSACHFAGFKKMMDMYENETKQVVIGPFEWDPWDDAANWADVPNPFIRKYLSTSPAQEPDGFEDNVKRAIVVLRDHPDPTTLFPGNTPRKYKIVPGGTWERI